MIEPTRKLKRVKLSEMVYEELRTQILSGSIQAGSRVTEREVSLTMGISRTPVREAFLRLSAEGLVKQLETGGVEVPELSLDKVREMFGVRKVLESYAAELACDHVTAAELQRLKKTIREAEKKLDSIEIEDLLTLNTKFHDLIYQASRNETLINMINGLRDLLMRVRALTLHSVKMRHFSVQSHLEIIQALENRDKDRINRLVAEHMEIAYSEIQRQISEVSAPESMSIP